VGGGGGPCFLPQGRGEKRRRSATANLNLKGRNKRLRVRIQEGEGNIFAHPGRETRKRKERVVFHQKVKRDRGVSTKRGGGKWKILGS